MRHDDIHFCEMVIFNPTIDDMHAMRDFLEPPSASEFSVSIKALTNFAKQDIIRFIGPHHEAASSVRI